MIERSNVQGKFEEIHNLGVDSRTTTSPLLGILFAYARGSEHITEIGVSNPCTTWALLHALEMNGGGRLVGIDIQNGYPSEIVRVEREAKKVGVEYRFVEINSIKFSKDQIEETDFLFIDSLHTREHLLAELDLYSPKTKNRIAFHDTEAPCRLLPAVEEWLATPLGSLWRPLAHYRLSHGLTIIERRPL